jgi:DNA-directed RNA polymerase specialized sigma24 family protein
MSHIHECKGCGTLHPAHPGCDGPMEQKLPSQAELFVLLEQIAADRVELDDDEREIVLHLRLTGTPWQQMAKRLGVHKTTLQRRYEDAPQ